MRFNPHSTGAAKNPLSFWERDCNSSEHEQEEIT
jgi:hypothetical protein